MWDFYLLIPSARKFRGFLVAFAALAAGGGAPASASAQPPPAAMPATPAPAGYHLAATWKPGGEGGWDYLSLDPAARRLYVARQDRIQVIDLDQGTLVGEVAGVDGAHGVALAPELHRGFASSGKRNAVVIFDLQTLQPAGAPVAVGQKPDAIIYEPSTRHVFAFNGQSDNASVIDAASGQVVATIPLGGAPEFAAADGKGAVFVNLEDKSETLAIDAKQNTVIQRWPLAPGDAPTGLALDAGRGRLFAGCHNAQMIVLDAASGKSLAALPIGQGVDACAFDLGTGCAFASCGDGTLTVAQENPARPGEFRVVENVKTQRGARTMALDPTTHAVYLAAADFAAAPPRRRGGKAHPPQDAAGQLRHPQVRALSRQRPPAMFGLRRRLIQACERPGQRR